MSSKAIPKSIQVASSSTEFEELYHKLLRLYYARDEREGAMQVAARLEAVLSDSPDYAHSIRGEEARSLISELREDYAEAIQSREAEIRKILELIAATVNTARWAYVSRQYDFSDVSDRLDLLAILYDKQGDLDRAIAILHESKQFCQSHQLSFDSQDLLDELEAAREGLETRQPTLHVPRDVLDDAIREVYERFGTTADEIVIADDKSRQFTAAVNRRLPKKTKTSSQDVKRRLLALRKRSLARGGLPKLKRGN